MGKVGGGGHILKSLQSVYHWVNDGKKIKSVSDKHQNLNYTDSYS